MMIQWINRHLKKNKGFTLIEMMVVLVIIALLILIALPGFQDYLTSGREVHDAGQSKILETEGVLSELDGEIADFD